MLAIHRPRRSAGITLLEVLVSCGLLILGLSTVAGLLPLAGSRLTQATTEDRAAVLLANAMAEAFNRGLVSADMFPAADPDGPVRTVALGKVLGRLPEFSDPHISEHFAAPSTEGRIRCGSSRTFTLEDVLAYDPPLYADTPVNAFSRDASGTGPRKYREGICWGATLRPSTAAPQPGERATLSIAIFKREGDTAGGQIAEGMPLVLTRVGSVYEANLAPARALLRGCSWLLAMPPDTSRPPRWFKIMSSWPWAGTNTRIILNNQDDFAQLTGASTAGSTAQVFAFEGIIRVDEQVVTLN